MKRVVSSGEVPHLWFHQTQGEARNANGSLYFSGATIYSYGSHFPIATHITIGKRSCVLFTTRTYSVTTSGHCSAVRSAIPSGTLVFHVPNVPTIARYASNDHSANLKDYAARVESELAHSVRARSSWKKEYSHGLACELRNEAREYAKFFKLPMPKIPAIPALDSKGMAAIKTKEAKKTAEKTAQEKARKIEQAKHDAELLERWRNGETVGYLYNIPIALRLNGDEIETTRGARVPVSHALRGLRFVRSVVAHGEAFQTNGHTFHLGHYKIDRVDADGTLHAGCHIISLAEIERIAPILEALPVQSD